MRTCLQCGTQIAESLLACPGCRALVHAAKLQQLADAATRSTQSGDVSSALASWRQALELLPTDSRQHAVISAKVVELSHAVDGGTQAQSKKGDGSKLGKGAAGLGALGALLAKFKFLLFFILTKAKLLLLGLTKASTFLSLLLSAGVYMSLWGWKFALGLVLSIYIHEMGHVQALNRFGIKATAPMFIPGFGALIRLKQYPTDPREDARVGLAGPIWGLGAALAAGIVFVLTRAPYWAGIARLGGFINLFNLTPVWQLDGARGFHALARWQRWTAVGVIAATWAATGEGLLVLLLIFAVIAASHGSAAQEPDHTALVQYAGLVAVLAALTRIPVVTGP